jgi:hypothetical protein
MTATTGWLTPAQRTDFLQGVEAAYRERRIMTERPKYCPKRLRIYDRAILRSARPPSQQCRPKDPPGRNQGGEP